MRAECVVRDLAARFGLPGFDETWRGHRVIGEDTGRVCHTAKSRRRRIENARRVGARRVGARRWANGKV